MIYGPPFAIPVLLSAKGSLYHLSIGIIENGYPVPDNRILNCKGVAPSHIKGGETVMGYPFEFTQCPLYNIIIIRV